MDAACQSQMIGILCGGENAAVCGALPVQALEVSAVVCQDGPADGVCAGQYRGIGRLGAPVFLRRYTIVTEPTQLLNDG
jgi:hypothetical protein